MADATNGYDVLKQLVQVASSVALVFLGAWLSTRSERRREAEKVRREQGYALAMLIGKLEQIALQCLQVANDEGEQDADDGRVSFAVRTPKLDLFDKDLDLKSLPAEMLLRLLDLPHDQGRINELIDGYLEHDDWDDLRDTLWVRRAAYASFGRRVHRIAHELRELGQLPRGAQDGQWTLDLDLETAERRVETEKRDFEARVARAMPGPTESP